MKIYLVTATWCGACKQMYAELEKANIPYTLVDADLEPSFIIEHNIRSIPTTLVIDEGKVLFRDSGLIPTSKLQEYV